MVPVREFMREKGRAGKEGLEAARRDGTFKVRPLKMEDFVRHDSHSYTHVETSSRKGVPGAYVDPVD